MTSSSSPWDNIKILHPDYKAPRFGQKHLCGISQCPTFALTSCYSMCSIFRVWSTLWSHSSHAHIHCFFGLDISSLLESNSYLFPRSWITITSVEKTFLTLSSGYVFCVLPSKWLGLTGMKSPLVLWSVLMGLDNKRAWNDMNYCS